MKPTWLLCLSQAKQRPTGAPSTVCSQTSGAHETRGGTQRELNFGEKKKHQGGVIHPTLTLPQHITFY